MKYFTQIEAFFNRNMSSPEQEAFEHEVKENADLARELNAYQVTTDLFDFTAENMDEDRIFGPTSELNTVNKRRKISNTSLAIFLAVSVLFLLGLFLRVRNLSGQGADSPQPVEVEKPKKNLPIAEFPSKPQYWDGQKNDDEVIETKKVIAEAGSMEETVALKKPSSSTNSRLSNALKKLEVDTEEANSMLSVSAELTSSALIASGEKIVFKADQQIKLTPGFHAKAGSSFKAVVRPE